MTGKLMSATAVAKLESGEVVLAAKDGIFIRKNGAWKHSFNALDELIRDLICIGNRIIGVGDRGTLLISENRGLSWSVGNFPTKTSIWSIVRNEEGVLVTHGDSVLYVSTDDGDTWKLVQPFQQANAPSIRSLWVEGDLVYIGTKVHRTYGGVWGYDMGSRELTRLKRESRRMISSLLTYEGLLLAASGPSGRNSGNIDFCHLHDDREMPKRWMTCMNPQQLSFLDISESDGRIYTTSTQNKQGFSYVASVCMDSREVVACNAVRGHGWRICSEADDYIVAGHYESIEFSSVNLGKKVM